MAVDWVTQNEGRLEHREAIARLVAMHRLIAIRRRQVHVANHRLRIFLLAASALTTGTLWVLLSDNFPDVTKWFGAGLSTLVTGLSAFQLTVGPAKVLEEIDELYAEFGRSLAHAREHPDNFSWHNFKHLEMTYLRRGVPDPTEDDIQSARISGML